MLVTYLFYEKLRTISNILVLLYVLTCSYLYDYIIVQSISNFAGVIVWNLTIYKKIVPSERQTLLHQYKDYQ